MSQALYRKYRSKKLSEIVGQAHITRLLERALKRGAVAHAYLLTGPRGVGKTSIARILAHEINNLPYTDESTHLDIIEIDAASNNSVEDIRDLRDKVQIAPVSAPKKVYIIDEVHMLSKSAFNALLKTLEEPPEHVVFILATTDADKLPATILSRVQRFNFRLIGEADVVAHLRAIAEAERIAIDDDALRLIAEQGQGSFRDSISLLDQLQHVADGAITAQLIEESLGLASAQCVARSGGSRRYSCNCTTAWRNGTQRCAGANRRRANRAEYSTQCNFAPRALSVAWSARKGHAQPMAVYITTCCTNPASEPVNTAGCYIQCRS